VFTVPRLVRPLFSCRPHQHPAPGVPAPAPQRTAATHASGADEFSYRLQRFELREMLARELATRG
jgi:hypothetical protein